MATPQQVPLKPDKTRVSWGYILVTILLGFLVRAQQIGRGDIAGAIGFVVGMMFFPTLIAYLIRGRKGDLRGFSRWFFWLGLFSLLAAAYNASHQH